MTRLATIQKGRTPRPPRLLVYGTEGIGKSSFAAQAPRPIFVQTEDGLDEIDTDKFPRAEKYEEVVESLAALANQDHPYESVVIDSLDWLERLIWDRVCRDANVTSIEKADGGYSKGYTHALTYWREILDLLNALVHGTGELRGQRSQLEVAAHAHEQLVLERVAKPRKDSAHRGLAQEQPLARARDVAFGQQHVERYEQVEIELTQVHRRQPREGNGAHLITARSSMAVVEAISAIRR